MKVRSAGRASSRGGRCDRTRSPYPTELLATRDFPKAFAGGLTAVLDYVPGHTLTDIIVRVPDRDVVFAGDLLFSREYPVAISMDMRRWRAALDRVRRLGVRTRFVPGHGGVCGQDAVSAQIDLVDDLHRHAERMIRAGATLEEAERRYQVPGAFKSYDVFSWGWTIGAAMPSYYSTR